MGNSSHKSGNHVSHVVSFLAGLRAAWRGDAGESILAVGLLGAAIALLVTGIGEATLGARLTPPAFVTLGLLAGLGSGAAGGAGGAGSAGGARGRTARSRR